MTKLFAGEYAQEVEDSLYGNEKQASSAEQSAPRFLSRRAALLSRASRAGAGADPENKDGSGVATGDPVSNPAEGAVEASAEDGEDREVNLKHTMTWVDTLPPEWLLPAVEHLRHGVHVVNGEESTLPIFDFTYGGSVNPYDSSVDHGLINTMQVRSANQVFWYPDQVKAVPGEECQMSFSQKAYSSASSFAKSKAMGMGLDVTLAIGGAFSASLDVSSAEEQMESGEKEMLLGRADCVVSSVLLDDRTALNPRFVKAIDHVLEAKADSEELFSRSWDLLSKYGSHYYQSTDLGGELLVKKFVERKEVARSSSLSVAAGAGGGGGYGGVNVKASVGGEYGSSSSKSSSSSSSDESITARGGKPGSFQASAGDDAAFGAWAKTLVMQPLPINEKLRPLSDLVRLHAKGESEETMDLLARTMSAATRDIVNRNGRSPTTTYVVFAVYGGDKPTDEKPSKTCPTPTEASKEPAPAMEKQSHLPVLDVYGSKGELQDWELVPSGGMAAYQDGAALMFTRSAPSVGEINEIDLKMRKGFFRIFYFFEMGTGSFYVFNTLPENGETTKKGMQWAGAKGGFPLPLSAYLLRSVRSELGAELGDDWSALEPLTSRFGTRGAAVINSVKDLLHAPTKTTRYEVLLVSSSASGIAADGDVQVSLRTESGLVSLTPSMYQDLWWPTVGHHMELVTPGGNRCPLVNPVQNPVTRNFPADEDKMPTRVAMFAYEGPDNGPVEAIEVAVAASDSSAPPVYTAEEDVQRDVAISICQRLLQGFPAPGQSKPGPAATDDCSSIADSLQQISDEAHVSANEASCQQVKKHIGSPDNGVLCTWDEQKNAWFFVDDKGKVSKKRCEYFKPAGDDPKYTNPCVDMFAGAEDIFTRSVNEPAGKNVLVKSAYVMNYRSGGVSSADFDGEYVIAGGVAERELL